MTWVGGWIQTEMNYVNFFAFDALYCSDQQRAMNSEFVLFVGIAINKDGVIYFADGANIRTIDSAGIIRTVIGSQGHPKYFQPLPCYKVTTTADV